MKTMNENTLHGYRLAQRMGAKMSKRVICPGCGRVKSIDALDFELLHLDGKIKEIVSDKADGLLWCADC